MEKTRRLSVVMKHVEKGVLRLNGFFVVFFRDFEAQKMAQLALPFLVADDTRELGT